MVESEEFGSGGNFDGALGDADFADTTTVYPFSANVNAICLPIPLDAPMTTTTRSEFIVRLDTRFKCRGIKRILSHTRLLIQNDRRGLLPLLLATATTSLPIFDRNAELGSR